MKKDKQNKILLTGGHAATTALALVNEVKKRHGEWGLYWVGPKFALEGAKVPTLASQVLPRFGVNYVPVTMGRIQRKLSIWTVPSLIKIPVGFFESWKILLTIKPKIIISFGGYASVPVCFWAWVLKIPIIIHEQTVAVGRANKVCSKFATKILLARKESEIYFPSKKTVVIGNPTSETIKKIKPKEKIGHPPTIYITGGSTGAQRINKVVEEILPMLLKDYHVIHQTGKIDFEKFKKLEKPGYEVYDFIDPTHVSTIFDKADIIISRAGANTLSEIMVTRRPAILIPIPWTAYDEQTLNAHLVEKSGIATVILEKNLTAEVLLAEIDLMTFHWKEFVKRFDDSLAKLDRDAARKFVDEVDKLLAS